MEDAFKDEITEEERAIQMGEVVPDEDAGLPASETPAGTGTLEAEKPAQETEKPAVEAAATETKEEKPEALTEEEKKEIEASGFKFETDKKGRTYVTDADGTKVPEARFGKIYREGKEAKSLKQERDELKQKSDLLKQLGPEEFYRLYPDEAPEGYKPPERKAASPAVPDGFDVMALQVKGGKYDGYTLRDVMGLDADEGLKMFNRWKDGQASATREQEEKVTQTQRERKAEATSFGLRRAKELFGVEDEKNLTPEQDRKIILLGQEVLAWQMKNNCLHYSWEDAYRLMKYDETITKAREEGAKGAVKGLQKAGPVSIDTTGGGGVQPTGWEAVSTMTEKEFEAHIDGLDDAGMTKFLKEAPASIRTKFPSMPWK